VLLDGPCISQTSSGYAEHRGSPQQTSPVRSHSAKTAVTELSTFNPRRVAKNPSFPRIRPRIVPRRSFPCSCCVQLCSCFCRDFVGILEGCGETCSVRWMRQALATSGSPIEHRGKEKPGTGAKARLCALGATTTGTTPANTEPQDLGLDAVSLQC
jgi:hypothetical protein